MIQIIQTSNADWHAARRFPPDCAKFECMRLLIAFGCVLMSDPRDTQKLHDSICQLAVIGYMSNGETKTPSISSAENIMVEPMRRKDLNIDKILKLGPVKGPPPHGPDPLTMSVPNDLEYLTWKFGEALVL